MTGEWRITIKANVVGKDRERLAYVLNGYGSSVEPGVWLCYMSYAQKERLKGMYGNDLSIQVWPPPVEFVESLGGAEERPPPPTKTLHCTDEELFSAIMPVLHDRMMRFAAGDAHQAEVWAAEVALGLYEALKPYLR